MNGTNVASGVSLATIPLEWTIAATGDSLYVFAAASVRRFFTARPGWGRWSKPALAAVFAALAVRLAWEQKD